MHVIIVGGGASGMMAALFALDNGNRVTILEGRDRVGKKLLSTGNGRCNLSNDDDSLKHYHSREGEEAAGEFAGIIFNQFSFKDTRDYFEGLGIYLKNKNGYYYPYSEQASAVLDAMRFALREKGAEIICDCEIKSIKKGSDFSVKTNKGELSSDILILATGSKAGIKNTCTDGCEYAGRMGHRIIKPLPALTAINSDEKLFKGLAGIRTQASVTLFDDDNKVLASDTGEVQLTSYGISGIPVFQVSHIAAERIEDGKSVRAELDLLPELNEEDTVKYLTDRQRKSCNKSTDEFFIGMFHKNLGTCLMKICGIAGGNPCSGLSGKDLNRLAENIKHFKVSVNSVRDYSDAQVCSGGVAISEVDEHLRSKIVDGLYIVGELLDIHGDCGGYNLEWAFAGGAVAGRNIKD